MEFPYWRELYHHHEEHEEERRGTQYDPGNYAPQPPLQPYFQIEDHADGPFSQEEYHSHQASGHVVHHESHHLFQRPAECGTASGSFRGPNYPPSEDSLPWPSFVPRLVSFEPSGRVPDLPRGQVVRVFCKADPNFYLAIRNEFVVLVYGNPNDKFQKWIKDETYSTRVNDEARSFSLVNCKTGQALKHGLGETQRVFLTDHQPNTIDESILWTMSGDIRDGYKEIRLVNNSHLVLDAFLEDKKSGISFDASVNWTMRGDIKERCGKVSLVHKFDLNLDDLHGEKNSGGIKDGNTIVLSLRKKGDNQLWKIVPY